MHAEEKNRSFHVWSDQLNIEWCGQSAGSEINVSGNVFKNQQFIMIAICENEI
jgi:hypothetical protein